MADEGTNDGTVLVDGVAARDAETSKGAEEGAETLESADTELESETLGDADCEGEDDGDDDDDCIEVGLDVNDNGKVSELTAELACDRANVDVAGAENESSVVPAADSSENAVGELDDDTLVAALSVAVEVLLADGVPLPVAVDDDVAEAVAKDVPVAVTDAVVSTEDELKND